MEFSFLVKPSFEALMCGFNKVLKNYAPKPKDAKRRACRDLFLIYKSLGTLENSYRRYIDRSIMLVKYKNKNESKVDIKVRKKIVSSFFEFEKILRKVGLKLEIFIPSDYKVTQKIMHEHKKELHKAFKNAEYILQLIKEGKEELRKFIYNSGYKLHDFY